MLTFNELVKQPISKTYYWQAILPGVESIFVKGGTYPYTVLESYSHLDANSVKYYAGPNDVEDVDLIIYETENNVAWNFFKTWNELVINPDGTYNLPSTYKKDFEVHRFRSSNTEAEQQEDRIANFKLGYEGAWPKRISDYTPDWDNRDVLIFTVTLSVDSVKSRLLDNIQPLTPVGMKPLPTDNSLPKTLPTINNP